MHHFFHLVEISEVLTLDCLLFIQSIFFFLAVHIIYRLAYLAGIEAFVDGRLIYCVQVKA
jgi:hypothetical protein